MKVFGRLGKLFLVSLNTYLIPGSFNIKCQNCRRSLGHILAIATHLAQSLNTWQANLENFSSPTTTNGKFQLTHSLKFLAQCSHSKNCSNLSGSPLLGKVKKTTPEWREKPFLLLCRRAAAAATFSCRQRRISLQRRR